MIWLAIYPVFLVLLLGNFAWRPQARPQWLRDLMDAIALALGGLAVLALVAFVLDGPRTPGAFPYILTYAAILAFGGVLLICGVLTNAQPARICGWSMIVLICLYPTGFTLYLLPLGLVAHVLQANGRPFAQLPLDAA